jgi:hypothetical protein
MVADNLNKMGYLPHSAREFKPHNIQSIISRKVNDPVINAEIEKVINILNQTNK